MPYQLMLKLFFTRSKNRDGQELMVSSDMVLAHIGVEGESGAAPMDPEYEEILVQGKFLDAATGGTSTEHIQHTSRGHGSIGLGML